mgnify:CR=1 FL=1
MSIVLGIFDGTHDAGACLIEDGRLVLAVDEERLTRQKGQGGFPIQSIKWCLAESGRSLSEMDQIAMAGFINPNPILRMFRQKQRDWRLDEGHFYSPNNKIRNWTQFQSPFPRLQYRPSTYWSLYKKFLQQRLSKQLKQLFHTNTPPIELYDHHHCHAASAYFSGGHLDALVVVADGVGDGIALSIWTGNSQTHQLQQRLSIPFPHSLGLLYASFTGFLGYKPFRHEGKITGLSAHGDRSKVKVAHPFTGPFPHRKLRPSFPLYDWLEQFSVYQPADIAAWLQDVIETELVGILEWAYTQFGDRPLVMAGGLVANVALNATIAKKIAPPDFFVFPNMGDAGLAVGAGYLSGHQHFGWRPTKIQSVYLGPSIEPMTSTDHLEISEPLSETELCNRAVEALSQGKIIARAIGRMEYGPRALGQRSILCSAKAPAIHSKLNLLLNRSDIMPFAPIMRSDIAESWLDIPDSAWSAMEWMTITVQAKPKFQKRCPAVVHLDGSLRPQLVYQHKHPHLWKLLKHFEEKTGEPALINTSFNLHEEPIVCTKADALNTFTRSELDALWLGDHWVMKK